MKPELEKYRNMSICVAVSGGKDSMALLHYLYHHGSEYGITLSALNCDHGIRGERSTADSAFVREWCEERGIPLMFFCENCVELAKLRGVSVELAAREWRQWCYFKAAEKGYVIATAHHLNDNAETVLFNLARGSSLSGVTGINDGRIRVNAAVGDDNLPCPVWKDEKKRFCTVDFNIIRPLIQCTREEIDEYVAVNRVPFVEDETNFSDEYTRNKIRHNVLPELERAVPGATKAIYRFSCLAQETLDYLNHQVLKMALFDFNGGALIKHCAEKVPFSFHAVHVVKNFFSRKDYTLRHIESLYDLQYACVGKKFEFLNLIAYKERGRIVIFDKNTKTEEPQPFAYNRGIFNGLILAIAEDKAALPMYARDDSYGKTYLENKYGYDIKVLHFDRDKIPDGAVIRTRRKGDRFTKFGGGTKSLGDYFTDKKIALRLREILPLIAIGNDVLAICGVEISDKIKIEENTLKTGYIYCDAIM